MAGPWSSPFGLMRSFMEDIDRMMGGFGRLARSDLFAAPFAGSGLAGWSPPLTMMERDGTLVIRADVPGLKPEQVRVELEDRRLTIAGERTEESSKQESSFYRNERRYGAFRRVIGLPEGIDAEHVSATFDNGVLEVNVPAPQRKKVQRIEVKTAQNQNQNQDQSLSGSGAGSMPQDQNQSGYSSQGSAI
jgi:HSP20 family protein